MLDPEELAMDARSSLFFFFKLATELEFKIGGAGSVIGLDE
jgi:hypothetical protein